jgi:nicotinamide mononucleotide transporter
MGFLGLPEGSTPALNRFNVRPMSPIELAAAALGLANILLIIRRSVWNFPVAVAMVALFALLFWQQKLYSDALLQLFFIAANVYGWWAWKRNTLGGDALVVRSMSARQSALWIGFALIATALWGHMMATKTDASYPYWDASILMLSMAAQIIMARRYVENWHWWIVVNLLSIPLYVIKGLSLSAGLYGVFLVLAIVGLVEWRKAEAQQI